MPLLSTAAIAVAATVFFLLFLWASFVSASPGTKGTLAGQIADLFGVQVSVVPAPAN